MPKFAQINAGGVCFAQLETAANMAGPSFVLIGANEDRLGQRWTGSAWEAVQPTAAEAAAAKLAQIDAETGMGRSLREALIAIGDKTGAVLTYLKTKEAEAAAERAKLPK